MKRQQLKKTAGIIVLIAMSMTIFTGCTTSDAAVDTTTQQMETTKTVANKESEAVLEDTEEKSTETVIAEMEDFGYEEGTLPEFVYVGNSVEDKVCTMEAKALTDERYAGFEDDHAVMIPAYVIVDSTETSDGIEVLVNLWTYRYTLDGTTLVMLSGGSCPCRIYARTGDNGLEIYQVDIADETTDIEDIEICNGDETLRRKLYDMDAMESSRKNLIGMYVNNYGLDITAYQDNDMIVSLEEE